MPSLAVAEPAAPDRALGEAERVELREKNGVIDSDGRSGQSSDGRFVMVRTGEVALVVANTWLSTHVWLNTFKTTIAEGFDVALVGPTGDLLFGPPRDSRRDLETAIPAVTRAADDPSIPWRVRF